MKKYITTKPGTGSAWADPGFLDRGFKFTKWGFDLPEVYLNIYQCSLIFWKVLHENEIIMSQRGDSKACQNFNST